MKDDGGIRTIYRSTLEGLNASADADIEKLRWMAVNGQIREHEASLSMIGKLCSKDEAWCQYAFTELRFGNFIENNVSTFTWISATEKDIAIKLDALCGMEAAAIIRSQSIDMSRVHWELEFRLREFLRAAESRSVLSTILSLQRFFLTLVASVGSAELFSEYAGLAKSSLCYAWSLDLSGEDIPTIASMVQELFALMQKGDGREACRVCNNIRFLPNKDTAEAVFA